jgi:hypothetical protein
MLTELRQNDELKKTGRGLVDESISKTPKKDKTNQE